MLSVRNAAGPAGANAQVYPGANALHLELAATSGAAFTIASIEIAFTKFGGDQSQMTASSDGWSASRNGSGWGSGQATYFGAYYWYRKQIGWGSVRREFSAVRVRGNRRNIMPWFMWDK